MATCVTRMSTLDSPVRTIFGTICILLALCTFPLNVLVIYIIRRFNRKKQKRHQILLSLAVSDMLSGCIVLPMLTLQLLHDEYLRNCSYDNIRSYISALLIGCSSLSLGVISLDRYLLLTKLHNYYRYMTKRATYIMIACCWLLPAVTPIFRYILYVLYQILMGLIFALPFVVLLVCYILISRAVKKADDNIKQQTTKLTIPKNTKTLSKQSANVKLAKAATLLIMCYFLCVFPTVIWIFFDFFDTSMSTMSLHTKEVYYLVSMVMCLLNSCMNPLIYFIKTPEFRRSFKSLFNRVDVSSTVSNDGETSIYPRTPPVSQQRCNSPRLQLKE